MNFFDALYLGAAVPLSPIAAYRTLTDGRFRKSLPERFGRVPPRSGGFWIHAASVGEVNTVKPLVSELRKRRPALSVAVSTVTAGGRDNAINAFPNDTVGYAPLDLSCCVRAAFARWRPRALVIVEQEIWPNLILEADVPVFLVNGRMSPRSFDRYRRFAGLARRVLRRLDRLFVQTADYRDRYLRLGVSPDRIEVTGNLKFDSTPSIDIEEQRRLHRALLNLASESMVVVGASTHHPEEELLVDAFQTLAPKVKDLRLILAPRHLERVREVIAMAASKGLEALPLSERVPRAIAPITVIDQLGKLAPAFSVATVVFVGGTIYPRGGQNMIEPASMGKPVVVGPSLFNFRDVADTLREAGGLRIVRNAAELAPALEQMLQSPERLVDMALKARAVVASGKGAAGRIAEALLRRTMSQWG